MAYSESDTRVKLIDPQIKQSHWLESNIVRAYYVTDGRKCIGRQRGKRYFELQMKLLTIDTKDIFDYNFGNTPPPPLCNVPTRGSSL